MAREGPESEGAIYVADDLVSIFQLTDHSILNCLRERYRDDQIYVSCYSGRDMRQGMVPPASSLLYMKLYIATDN